MARDLKPEKPEERLLLDLYPQWAPSEETPPSEVQGGSPSRPYMPPRLRLRRDQDEALVLILSVLDG